MASSAHYIACISIALAGPAAAQGAPDPEDLIAFCQFSSGAVPAGITDLCFCSVGAIEQPLTPGQFVRYLHDRLLAGATSAAELRAATRHARDVCKEDGAAVFPRPRRTDPVAPVRGEAP
ncbi:hypothetical protein [Falsiroseomonas sp. HW251]|uniref:hypothetical protein n=1 Tax=Falsiroseomonas sp. HW251 TaxID=3390998 RepID=UPI003D322F0E